jgi:hypothetical protein
VSTHITIFQKLYSARFEALSTEFLCLWYSEGDKRERFCSLLCHFTLIFLVPNNCFPLVSLLNRLLNTSYFTSTGSATAIALIFPELKGKLNGHAIRVPLINSSITDCVFEVKRPVTKEEVNALFKEAAQTYLKDILGYEERPLVSTDYINDRRSSIVDAASTLVVDGTHLKIYSWYDNEYGYSARMVDLAKIVIGKL